MQSSDGEFSYNISGPSQWEIGELIRRELVLTAISKKPSNTLKASILHDTLHANNLQRQQAIVRDSSKNIKRSVV